MLTRNIKIYKLKLLKGIVFLRLDMNEEKKKAYQDVLKKHSKSRRANETPQKAMSNFEKYMEETVSSGMPNKLKKMQEKVKEELKHIPDWPEPQGELRMIYQARRIHSLSEKVVPKQTAKEVLKECISDLKPKYPDFQFLYDESFFNKCG